MLSALEIRDLVLIEHVALDFQPGLNVLTGETGAGKSILLDALGLALGWRTRADLVRPGAAEGSVIAQFRLPEGHPARAVLAEAGLGDADELILRRAVTADGRRQGFANDRRVAAETLRLLGDSLVELHGQADDRGLMDARGHRPLLDAFAGEPGALAAVREAWAALRAARAAREAAAARAETEAREADYLGHAVAELDRLAPEPGEEPELDARRRRLQAAERVGEDLARAAAALGTEGAEGAAFEAMRRLEAAAGKAEGALDAALEGIGRVLAELGEVERAVAEAAETLAADPLELERVEERLFAIRGLARKHGVLPEELPELHGALAARLGGIAVAEAELARLAEAEAEAGRRYAGAAAALAEVRRAAAARLDARMAEELPPLRLERARFATEIAPAEPGPEGTERVGFTAATAPGLPPGPLNRIASGGELSRFLLALKVCLTDEASALTLVFDEIDRGVGGATADAVGRRLQALGERAQVLVVTHSPQVAALGAHHWRIGKTVSETGARTEVARLGPAERVGEIARMLAGEAITDAARSAARALLAG